METVQSHMFRSLLIKGFLYLAKQMLTGALATLKKTQLMESDLNKMFVISVNVYTWIFSVPKEQIWEIRFCASSALDIWK